MRALEKNAKTAFRVKIVKSKRMEVMIGVSRAKNELQNYFTFSCEGWGVYLGDGKKYTDD